MNSSLCSGTKIYMCKTVAMVDIKNKKFIGFLSSKKLISPTQSNYPNLNQNELNILRKHLMNKLHLDLIKKIEHTQKLGVVPFGKSFYR